MIINKVKKLNSNLLLYSLYGIIFFIPISTAAIEIFFSFALLFFILNKLINPDFGFLVNKFYLFLAFFICFTALSLVNSGIYFEKSCIAFIFKWFQYILMFIIFHDTFLANPRYTRDALRIFFAIAVLMVIDGIFQQLAGIDFIRLVEFPRDGISATFKNRNDFAAYLVPIFFLLIAFLLNRDVHKMVRRLHFVLLFLILLCLILTFSRGAWVGFFLGLFLFTLLLRKKKIMTTFVCIVATFILVPPLRSRLFSSNDAFRFTIWRVASSIIRENPFLGKGVGTFMDYFSKYHTRMSPQYAHNCFLQIWAETGIFSLMSFLVFNIYLLFISIQKFKKNKDFVLLGLVIGMFGFLVHSFLDTQLYSLQLRTLYWVWMGMIAAKISSDSKPQANDIINNMK